MVTSFRPRCPSVRDDTVLKTVIPVSDLSKLYFQFSEYRLELLEERIRTQLKRMRETEKRSRKFDVVGVKRFLQEQGDFLTHMVKEMVEYDLVKSQEIDMTIS